MRKTFATLAALLLAQTAQAHQMECGARHDVLAGLGVQYGEIRQNEGLDGNGNVMETFASPATATWTILITLPDGRACILASGTDYVGAKRADQVPG